jgi:hypothetical protein
MKPRDLVMALEFVALYGPTGRRPTKPLSQWPELARPGLKTERRPVVDTKADYKSIELRLLAAQARKP